MLLIFLLLPTIVFAQLEFKDNKDGTVTISKTFNAQESSAVCYANDIEIQGWQNALNGHQNRINEIQDKLDALIAQKDACLTKFQEALVSLNNKTGINWSDKDLIKGGRL